MIICHTKLKSAMQNVISKIKEFKQMTYSLFHAFIRILYVNCRSVTIAASGFCSLISFDIENNKSV